MPELTSNHLSQLIVQNQEVYVEVESLVQRYLMEDHPRGWEIVEGCRKWMEDHHFLLQAPIRDSSLGGFIYFQNKRHICYVNTWQPRVYQNFMLLHELYHILTEKGLTTSQPLHLVEPDLDESIDERKADYFASLLLINGEQLKLFLDSMQGELPQQELVFYAMKRFGAPYKAVLIRMFEINRLNQDSLWSMFDSKYDFEAEFEKIGLDKACVQRSNLVKFDRLEALMQANELPATAQNLNLETLQAVKKYFDQQKG